ncbi:MAG: hydantoinase/oxoprolinase family protein [Ekhidna sp.]|nr:hydantoinase/oxoprolinase family protein [Ekhidna sp.]
MYKIGIDVGGTNTDAVIIDDTKKIVSKTKHLTTDDIVTGVSNVLKTAINQVDLDTSLVTHVMLGTTHCTNAFIERKNLNKVAHFRIGAPSAKAIAPLSDWPKELVLNAAEYIFHVNGGYEFDGRLITQLDEQEIIKILESLKGEVSAISVTGIFSKINPSQELRFKELAGHVLGEAISVSMSHQIGGLGLLERENATAINAALMNIASQMVAGFHDAVSGNGIDANLYVSQNDGSLMSLNQAKNFPVLTISSGPTNSLRGASALSELNDAIVIDVGGTTSDAGILVNSFPRESNKHSYIGGVRTNFRMPDIISIGVGGGTIIDQSNEDLKVGPTSVGYHLTSKALSFGGDTLTLTDIALSQKKMNIRGTSGICPNVDEVAPRVEAIVRRQIEQLIDLLKTDSNDIPLILVGGGASILPDTFKGVSSIISPAHGEVANAFGVAIASVSGESESVVNLNNESREDAIRNITEKARQNAILAGADSNTISVVNVLDNPLAYLPNTTKIKVKVIGDLK